MDSGTLAMILATVQDTNARIRRMEEAWVAHVREEERWHRLQQAIAASLDPELATILEPVADAEPATDQTTHTAETSPTGARDSLAGARAIGAARLVTPLTFDVADPTGILNEVIGTNPQFDTTTPPQLQTPSPDRVFTREPLDADSFPWFVGKDGKYYVHGATPEEPDRRATMAEVRAIDAQVGSREKARPRRRVRS